MKQRSLVKVGMAVAVGASLSIFTWAMIGQAETAKDAAKSAEVVKLPQLLGLEDPNSYVPKDNPLTAAKVELGRTLFFDNRLSKNNTVACVSCHLPGKGFTDGKPVSTGVFNLKGGRSAPAAFNRVFAEAQFWDGRAATLEEQSIGPFTNPVEHGFANYDDMLVKMKKLAGYRKMFKDVFGTDVTMDGVAKAIASFQRTILSGNSPADRFDYGGEEGAISEEAKRGLELFRGKARCVRCH